MKVKSPPSPSVPPKNPEIQQASTKIVNTLAGLIGAQEEEIKKTRKDSLNEAEKKKRLKTFGLKCGIKANDTPREATEKLVRGVLDDEYDRNERGYHRMIEEISDYIQEQNLELQEKFNSWIKEIQKA